MCGGFRACRLAWAALERGGSAAAILNAANEVAVAAFLQRRVAFLDITRIIEETLQGTTPGAIGALEDVLEADRAGRERASICVGRFEAALA